MAAIIDRRLDQFVELHAGLRQEFQLTVPFPEERDVKSMESYLNKVLEAFADENLWDVKPLLQFIDKSGASMSKMSSICISMMQKQVDQLKAQNSLYDAKFEALQNNFTTLLGVVQQFAADQTSSSGGGGSGASGGASGGGAAALAQFMQKGAAGAAVPPGLRRQSGFSSADAARAALSTSTDDFDGPSSAAAGASASSQLPRADSDVLSRDDGDSMAGYLIASCKTSMSSFSPSPTLVFSRGNSDANTAITATINASVSTVDLSSLAATDSEALHRGGGDAALRREDSAASGSSSNVLPPECPFDAAVERVIDVLSPQESQKQYRVSVAGLVRRHTKLCMPLSATFELGLHALGANLPDDPVQLTAVFSPAALGAAHWPKTLLNRLQLAMTNPQLLFDPIDGGDYRPATNHMIGNVHYSDSSLVAVQQQQQQQQQQGGSGKHHQHQQLAQGSVPLHTPLATNVAAAAAAAAAVALHPPHAQHERSALKVHCVVDSIEVEVAANARADLCLLAFCDEVAALVGREDLFRRSLLLIRAWWVYETASYIGSVVKHYLCDNALVVMTLTLFNLHGPELRTPLGALLKFLQVFSKYDGFTEVITLQGFVPYAPQNRQPGVPAASLANYVRLAPTSAATHLIPNAMLEKYYRLVNATSTDAAQPNLYSPAGTELPSGAAVSASSSPRDLALGVAAQPSPTSPTAASTANALLCEGPVTVSVERNGYHVLSPFTLTNAIPEKMTTRRVVLIHKAFQIGLANLSAIVSKKSGGGGAVLGGEGKLSEGKASVAGDTTTLTAAAASSAILSFFPASMGRFKDAWRPDAIGNSLAVTSPVVSPHPPAGEQALSVRDRLLREAHYCAFVADGVVSEAALVGIAVDVLSARGAQPVGEIGKQLTDLSAAPHLSQRLKEGFGGLKKLLESRPDLFLLAGNHQFNPHITLRAALTPEQEEAVASGVYPPEIFAPRMVLRRSPPTLSAIAAGFGGVGGSAGGDDVSPGGYSPRDSGGGGGSVDGSRVAGGGGGSSHQQPPPAYLSYNVNTSIDRRMRQQQMQQQQQQAQHQGGGRQQQQLQQQQVPRMQQPQGSQQFGRTQHQPHPQLQPQQYQQHRGHAHQMQQPQLAGVGGPDPEATVLPNYGHRNQYGAQQQQAQQRAQRTGAARQAPPPHHHASHSYGGQGAAAGAGAAGGINFLTHQPHGSAQHLQHQHQLQQHQQSHTMMPPQPPQLYQRAVSDSQQGRFAQQPVPGVGAFMDSFAGQQQHRRGGSSSGAIGGGGGALSDPFFSLGAHQPHQQHHLQGEEDSFSVEEEPFFQPFGRAHLEQQQHQQQQALPGEAALSSLLFDADGGDSDSFAGSKLLSQYALPAGRGRGRSSSGGGGAAGTGGAGHHRQF